MTVNITNLGLQHCKWYLIITVDLTSSWLESILPTVSMLSQGCMSFKLHFIDSCCFSELHSYGMSIFVEQWHVISTSLISSDQHVVEIIAVLTVVQRPVRSRLLVQSFLSGSLLLGCGMSLDARRSKIADDPHHDLRLWVGHKESWTLQGRPRDQCRADIVHFRWSVARSRCSDSVFPRLWRPRTTRDRRRVECRCRQVRCWPVKSHSTRFLSLLWRWVTSVRPYSDHVTDWLVWRRHVGHVMTDETRHCRCSMSHRVTATMRLLYRRDVM